MLIIFSGLPGTGKSTLSRRLSHHLGATYLRIDSIEQAILRSSLAVNEIIEAGYYAAYALAEDNLRIGQTVVADSVNPIPLTREDWQKVATRSNQPYINIEIICTDKATHRARVEGRVADISGHKLPSWQAVETRDYVPWTADIVLDTAGATPDESFNSLLSLYEAHLSQR